MTIRSNIQGRVDEIMAERQARELDPNSPAPVSDAVENGSRAAIFGGRASNEWKEYMKLFADPKIPAELGRLVPPQPDPNPTREKARAYLVCNGMCGMTTGENLGDHIEDNLDY
jgi:hypothetical protein